MKTKSIFILFYFTSFALFAQTKQSITDSNNIVSFEDILYVDEINGMNVFDTDMLYSYIGDRIEKQRTRIGDERYPEIYVTSKTGAEFIKIWGAPDIGFRQFYTIGYTEGKKCSYCGINIGTLPFSKFQINKEIKLGDDIRSVWPKVHLNFFRRFKFNDVECFYFEKGIKQELPFVPNQLFYYKFKNDKLIEIGFGYGFEGVNPMLHSE